MTFGRFVWFKSNIPWVKDQLKFKTGHLLQCKKVTSLCWGFRSHITVSLQETNIRFCVMQTSSLFLNLQLSTKSTMLLFSFTTTYEARVFKHFLFLFLRWYVAVYDRPCVWVHLPMYAHVVARGPHHISSPYFLRQGLSMTSSVLGLPLHPSSIQHGQVWHSSVQ